MGEIRVGEWNMRRVNRIAKLQKVCEQSNIGIQTA
jgi:hypothetical protein